MRFSTRSTYGMRAMLALAKGHGQGSMFLKDLAAQENLPATYMEQLMGPLRKAGLVLAVRGARGGYTLAQHPSEITVLRILEALEGPLNLSDCPGGLGCCGRSGACALQELWDRGSHALAGAYRTLSLAAVLERQRELEADPVANYAI